MFEIILIVIGVLVLAVAGLLLVGKFKPELLTPLGKVLFRSKRIRKAAENKMIDELADDPQLLKEQLGAHLSKEQLKQFDSVMTGRTDAERKELLSKVVEAAETGRELRPEDIARKAPLTGDEARQKNKRKSHTRNKNKAARKARKNQRKR